MVNRATHCRWAVSELFTLFVLLASALMALKTVEAATGARFTAKVVVSGSMEPGIKRGDLLFFVKTDGQPIRAGDVILFESEEADTHGVVHRVIEVHERRDGDVDILTKGDNNNVDDAAFLYGPGQPFLHRHQVLGKAVGYLPGGGWLSIGKQELWSLLESWVRE